MSPYTAGAGAMGYINKMKAQALEAGPGLHPSYPPNTSLALL